MESQNQELKCPMRITYENKDTAFKNFQDNPELIRCVSCLGFDETCRYYNQYLPILKEMTEKQLK